MSKPRDRGVPVISVQSICPVHVAENLSMGSIDPVGYALVKDAITHEGTADPARIDRAVCAKVLMPGVDPLTLPVDGARYAGEAATTLATYPHVTRRCDTTSASGVPSLSTAVSHAGVSSA